MFVNVDTIVFLCKLMGLKFFLKILHKILTSPGFFANMVSYWHVKSVKEIYDLLDAQVGLKRLIRFIIKATCSLTS